MSLKDVCNLWKNYQKKSNAWVEKQNVFMKPKDKQKTVSFITVWLAGVYNHLQVFFCCRKTEKSIKSNRQSLTFLEYKKFFEAE